MSIVVRGDTEYWDIVINRSAAQGGGPYPLSGCTVWVTVKSDRDDPDIQALYQHWITVAANGTVSGSSGMTLGAGGAAGGTIVQKLEPEVSKGLVTGTYTYDVQIMLPNGDIHTPIRGATETVEGDWTHATTRPGA